MARPALKKYSRTSPDHTGDLLATFSRPGQSCFSTACPSKTAPLTRPQDHEILIMTVDLYSRIARIKDWDLQDRKKIAAV